jgi:hypothetical protein
MSPSDIILSACGHHSSLPSATQSVRPAGEQTAATAVRCEDLGRGVVSTGMVVISTGVLMIRKTDGRARKCVAMRV